MTARPMPGGARGSRSFFANGDFQKEEIVEAAAVVGVARLFSLPFTLE